MQPITIGTKASASVQVTEAQLAVTVGSGSLRVFATPMLAALIKDSVCSCCRISGGWRNHRWNSVGFGTYRSYTRGHDRDCNCRNYSGIRSGNHICHYCIR